MKKIGLIAVAFVAMACGSETKEKETVTLNRDNTVIDPSTGVGQTEMSLEEKVAKGKKLFDGKGNCKSCHMPDRKVIGPSLVEIATIYQEQNGDMVAFLREKADPIVDPSQYAAMKINLGITKRMPIQEVEAIEAYIQSFATPSTTK